MGAIKDPHDSANAARVAPVPPSDREILEALVLRFPAGGAMMHGEKMVLTAGYKHYELGQVLTLSYDGHEYDVEIVGITASRFTLRYRDTELTRSIQLSK